MIYFGLTFENLLDQAGHKPSKEERRARAAREKIIEQMFSSEDAPTGSGYADPAAMFG